MSCVFHSLYKATGVVFILCFYALNWSTIYLNIGVSHTGVAHVKRAIIGVLFTSGTPLYRCCLDAANVRLHKTLSPDGIPFVFTPPLWWCDVRCLILIDSDSCHFGDVAFVKNATPVSVPPPFHQQLSPKNFTTSPRCHDPFTTW